MAAFIALVSGPTAAQGLPPARDVPYLGAINLRVDATDVDHKPAPFVRFHAVAASFQVEGAEGAPNSEKLP